ncbi:hypothetical protein DSO57_1025479 [Entomophthora muscae]|uniref:Uncharacterized protein n=1 Tax=Entomophthora muscae TaxID=34485 RepID=A0ACC2S497_9FUNG|nr:hypothetical protein DSO57_1025479 [Entomophthora muscae]
MLEDNQMDIEESFDDASAKRKHDELTGLNERDHVISKNPPVSAGTAFHYDVSEASSLRTVSKVPLSRIKRILKEDNEFQGATTDAYTVISKATVNIAISFSLRLINLSLSKQGYKLIFKLVNFSVYI